jgi:hypothetical protein
MNDQSKDFSCSWLRLIVYILYFLSFIVSLAYQNLAYMIIRLIIYNVNMTHMLNMLKHIINCHIQTMTSGKLYMQIQQLIFLITPLFRIRYKKK